MKVIVVLSLVATAFASLEPAGYRPPGSAPSTRYLPANNYETPSTRYLPASQTQYSAPARASAPSSAYLPANDYQAAAQTSAISSRYSGAPAPAPAYGAPASSQYSGPVAVPANRYLPSNNRLSNSGSSGYRYNSMEESEPAKYGFQYEVKDNYGNDFGHRESRDGDNTQGMYTVVLPDGRKQIVEYTADQDGFKPRISYEEPKQGYSGAYNGQGGQAGGYSQGRPQGPY